MGLIDFEKLYGDYVISWTKKNAGKLKKTDNPEDFIDEIYNEWKNAPSEKLGGVSPQGYFDALDAKTSANLLKDYINEGREIPSPLFDRISGKKDCEGFLLDILKDKGSSNELVIISANILSESGSKKHVEILSDILLDAARDSEIREFAAEILQDYAETVEKKLIAHINDKEIDGLSPFLADVLVYAKGKQKTFSLLCRLFESGINNQLYAAYLGMYEDPRALPLLLKRLKSEELGYVEFLELRNSIERLGGEADIQKDFSDDPDFKALKHLK